MSFRARRFVLFPGLSLAAAVPWALVLSMGAGSQGCTSDPARLDGAPVVVPDDSGQIEQPTNDSGNPADTGSQSDTGGPVDSGQDTGSPPKDSGSGDAGPG